ncbi:hypothetical protein [Acidocella sp.]|uniref:hypothetical protein n=1 Tax=Acidocella sp. TaxID=50710 RepID=UPI003CFF570F
MKLETKIALKFLVGISFFSVAKAKVYQDSLLSPIENIGILQPPDPPPPGGPYVYGQMGPSPNWSIAQWNIPGGQLSAFQHFTTDKGIEWVASSREAEVRVLGSSKHRSVTLWQDGSVLPCMTFAGRPRESDLFLSANRGDLHYPSVLAMNQKRGASLALSSFNTLTVEANIFLSEGVSGVGKGCEVNQGSAIIGIILTSDSHPRKQTLFYKIILDKLCRQHSIKGTNNCSATPTSQNYYARRNPYGVNDFLNLVDGTLMSGQEERHLNINLLPRLIVAIRNGPMDMDKNLLHWSVTGFYVGQAIWGNVTLKSTWSNLRLLACRYQ